MNKFLSLALFTFSCASQANEFVEKPIEHFQPLAEFASVADYERPIAEYVQTCLDNSFGGSLSVRCFVADELWDKELNYYYRLLYRSLDSEGKAELKTSQLAWLASRDQSIEFNRHLIRQQYPQAGSMYVAIRAQVASDLLAPLIKQRALLLKQWLEILEQQPFEPL